MPRSVRCTFDDCPVATQFYKPAATDRPKESGVPKALKWTAAAAEQFQIIPTTPSGPLSPVFLGQEECVAVVDELTPPVRRNIPWCLMAFEAGDSINPVRRDAPAQ